MSGEILAVLYPQIRIIVNKDYSIPDYIDERTLAILISYSGNTEEILHNYRLLVKQKARIIILSSNGKLFKKKAELKMKVPQGLPPRGALGYLFAPMPLVLYTFHIIKKNPKKQLVALSTFLKHERDTLERKAEQLSKGFINKLPIIYANSQRFAPIANRWRCQLNENAKVLAHINVVPEMNHNEIVGLGRPEVLRKEFVVVFLNDPRAHPRNKLRVHVVKQIIHETMSTAVDVKPRGQNDIQRLFWTIMLGDFISYHLAIKTGIDPISVERIDYLKQKLAEYQ